MVEVYMDRSIIKNYKIIDFNDDLFDINFGNMKVDDTIRSLAWNIDHAKILDGGRILNKYGRVFDMSYLSTGCKTAINAYRYTDYVVNTIECGDNALQEIFKLKNCKILNRLGFSWSQQDTRNNIALHLKDGVKTFNSVNQLVDYLQEAQYG